MINTQKVFTDADCLARYKGIGVLILSNQQTISCTFEVIQLKKGEIFLICEDATPDFPLSLRLSAVGAPSLERFEGTTEDGLSLLSLCDYQGIVQTIDLAPTGLTWWLQRLSVEQKQYKETKPHSVKFGLTNLLLEKSLSLYLKCDETLVSFQIEPLVDYDVITRRISMMRTTDVTCQISALVSTTIETTRIAQMITDVSYLLSIAQGTPIQWLYQNVLNDEGEMISRIHGSRVAKIYRPGGIIPSHELQHFVEETYPSYILNRDRYQLQGGIIDAYLDASAEGDYLQIRGLKLVAVMEAIKAVFTNLPDDPVQEFFLNRSVFKKHERTLGDAISQPLHTIQIGMTPKEIAEKLTDFNRRPFGRLLDDIFARIELVLEPEEQKQFIQCRNALVHEGRFFCEIKARKNHLPQPHHHEITREYFFLVHFLDRVILRMLGYSGFYRDRSNPGAPSLKIMQKDISENGKE